MVTRMPANYRQSLKWIGNLDAPSSLWLGGGLVVALRVLTGTAAVATKVPEIAGVAVLAGVFGLGRWPLDLSGDSTSVWLRRAVAYSQRARRLSAWDGAAVRPGRGQDRHD